MQGGPEPLTNTWPAEVPTDFLTRDRAAGCWRIEALDSELSGFGELPDSEENSSVVGGLRSELSLAGERLRGTRAE